jgi:hypothetical protein
VAIDSTCGARGVSEDLSGTQVAVGPNGTVYIAYADIQTDVVEIRMRTSTDGGQTLTPTVVVGGTDTFEITAFGEEMQGQFRNNPFPLIAVDNSTGPNRGKVFVVWTDGSRNQVQDVGSLDEGFYPFDDIVMSSSSDGGNTWTAPSLVSPMPANFTGAGRDQFMPGVAVDPAGNVAVCYSDRRNDAHNFLVDHFCSVSHDHGASFTDVRETSSSWTPTHGTDILLNPVYMGDYDAVSSDATGKHQGFFNTFQVQTNTNPDVFGKMVQ